MSSRYDELERLQRLREGGALSDDEFQAEKARVLGLSAPPPDLASAAPEGAPSRRPLYWALGGLALILAVAAGLLLGRVVGGPSDGETVNPAAPPETDLAEENLVAPPPVPDIRALPAPEQLARAFEAAFGRRGSAILHVDSGKDYQTDSFPEDVRYAPGRLIWPSYGPVLLSEGRIENAAHVSAGKIAIHYLKPAGDRFEVVRAFPTGVVTGSFGQVARWSVSPRFSNWPTIVAEGGGTWQGYSCSWLTLTELRPEGPVEVATLPLSYDDGGAKGEAEATSIEGGLGNVVKGRSFEIRYSGSDEFVERYVRSGRKYAREGGGETRMRTC